MNVMQVLQQALQLPERDRWDLVAMLLEQLDDRPGPDEDDPAWVVELERRIEDVHSGKDQGIPAHQSIADIRKRLRQA